MPLGDKIKQLRKSKKITQGEFADKMHVSRQTISNWENNKSYPSMDFIVSISESFDVSIDSLIKEDVAITREELNVEEKNSDRTKIQTNKERVVLERFLFFRLQFIWIGTFIAVYLYASNTYVQYIWVPIAFVLFGLLATLPIRMIRKKNKLKESRDVLNFYNELYK